MKRNIILCLFDFPIKGTIEVRLELTTLGLEDLCSIRLSYSTIMASYKTRPCQHDKQNKYRNYISMKLKIEQIPFVLVYFVFALHQ